MNRITALELQTDVPLARMADFYGQTLQLPAEFDGADRLVIVAGETRLTFGPASPGIVRPYYHFAFNIPENQIGSAREWQLQRTPLWTMRPALHDPAWPPDVAWFQSWNAHSIYFVDPAGNILEYIARHSLPNSSAMEFDSRSVLCISEIGLVVDDVPAEAQRVCDFAQVTAYRDGDETFLPLGDEHGLLLMMKHRRDLSLGTRPGDFPAGKFPLKVGLCHSDRKPSEIRVCETWLFSGLG